MNEFNVIIHIYSQRHDFNFNTFKKKNLLTCKSRNKNKTPTVIFLSIVERNIDLIHFK